MKKPLKEKAKMYKTCVACASIFERNKKYSNTQWESATYCSNNCSFKSRDHSYLKTPERREFMRQLNLGKKASEETRKKMSLSSPKIRLKGELRGKAWKGGVSLQLKYKQLMWRKRRAIQLNAEGSHTEEEWQQLKEKFLFSCLCCKKQEPFIRLTQDHIVPLSRGGNDYISNIQPLCQSCNSRKNTKTIDYATTYLIVPAIGFDNGIDQDEELED